MHRYWYNRRRQTYHETKKKRTEKKHGELPFVCQQQPQPAAHRLFCSDAEQLQHSSLLIAHVGLCNAAGWSTATTSMIALNFSLRVLVGHIGFSLWTTQKETAPIRW